jgi:uncharacterized membrane protein YczE
MRKEYFADLSKNRTTAEIMINFIIAAISLFFNGLGIYLIIKAGIGVAPWDVFNLGLSKTFGILYGTASITVAVIILIIDILMKEPIGLAMLIDSVVVGKAVDFFNYINLVHESDNLIISIIMLFGGLVIMGYTQLFYMKASLGCGPRDTLLVGLKKRISKVPIGIVSMGLLCTVTFVGFLLGGPIGIGTVLCAVFQGPIMQAAFKSFSFDATRIEHQSIPDSIRVLVHGHA